MSWLRDLYLHRKNYHDQDCDNWVTQWPCTDRRLCLLADLLEQLSLDEDEGTLSLELRDAWHALEAST